jgi:hypothetical protein
MPSLRESANHPCDILLAMPNDPEWKKQMKLAKKTEKRAPFTFTRETFSGKVLAKGKGNSLREAMNDADHRNHQRIADFRHHSSRFRGILKCLGCRRTCHGETMGGAPLHEMRTRIQLSQGCKDSTEPRTLTRFGPDKALYITDTTNSKIYKLSSGASTAELFLEHRALYGVDGITFLNGTLYVNNRFSNNLYRIPVDAAGKAGQPVDIWMDQRIKGPDGMRAAMASLS